MERGLGIGTVAQPGSAGGEWGSEAEPEVERGLGNEERKQEQGSEDQKPAVLVVEEMKILLVWWYGGMIFSFE